jgi:hypothetical protein
MEILLSHSMEKAKKTLPKNEKMLQRESFIPHAVFDQKAPALNGFSARHP